jgi:DNA-binding FrmR family transcriptional regulator
MVVVTKQTPVESRINRVAGQVEGIRRMVHAGRSPEDIAQQILAAREALTKVGLHVIKEGMIKTPEFKKKSLITLLEKLFKL